MFAGQRLRGLVAKENAADLEARSELIRSGAPDAVRYLAERHAEGGRG
jgi:hypothetical protein